MEMLKKYSDSVNIKWFQNVSDSQLSVSNLEV